MPADYSRYGVTEILDEDNRIQIRQIIEELGKGTHQKGSVEQMIGDLYTLLMDSARINKEGISPIKADMQKIEAIKSREEIVPVMSEMGVTGGGEFFGFYIDADMKNSMANLVQLNQGGLTLRIKDYYLDTDEATVKIREAFQKYIVDLFLKYGYDNATSTRIKDNVMSIETRLAKASRSLIEMRDPEKNYNKMSYENLK
jgi:putative endopeptidase